MRTRLLVLAAMLAVGRPYLVAQQQSSDEVAIRAVLARETDGWNKFDARQVASTFTTDALWQNPFGVRLHGQAEILKFLTDLLARPRLSCWNEHRADEDPGPAPHLADHSCRLER